MKFTDKPEFEKKMDEVARVVGRSLESEDVDAYFHQLEDYSLELVSRALDLALKSRDPEDLYMMSKLPTVPEVEAAIVELSRPTEERVNPVASCAICSGNGWLTGMDAKGRTVAWPCKCLYEVAKEALKKKVRPGSAGAHLTFYRKRIVASYEAHQKNWGGDK